MLNLNTRIQSAQPPAEPADTESRIARIFKAIDELRVVLKELYEELEKTGSPEKRMELRHRIDGVEQMIEAMRQQIIALTQLEQRRKAQRHGLDAGSLAARPPAEAGGQDGGGEPDLYHPPGMQPVSDA